MLRQLVFILVLVFPLLGFAEDFVAGKDYELVQGAAENKTVPKKVAVTEFFSYGCPWCYRIDPALTAWVKQQGDKINFSRVPVVFNKDWVFYAKAYYTAHLLGLENKLSPLLFKTVQDQGSKMNSNQAMIDFFIAQGVDQATAKSAFENSTTIDMQVKDSTLQMSRYHINGVPAIVVNKQFKTDLQMAQSEERLLNILNFLVAKANKQEEK